MATKKKVVNVSGMIKSIEALYAKVTGPVKAAFGPRTRILTVELHGEEVKGLALCPGKVVRYVLDAQSEIFRTVDILTLHKNSRKAIQNTSKTTLKS